MASGFHRNDGYALTLTLSLRREREKIFKGYLPLAPSSKKRGK
jgi:hypothetical protein